MKFLVKITIALLSMIYPARLQAQSPKDARDPIAYFGHGALFSQDGREIRVTPDFIRTAQRFYIEALRRTAPLPCP